MQVLRFVSLPLLLCAALSAQDPTQLTPVDEIPDDGYLALEGSFGYNTYPTSGYFRAPLFFTGASAYRNISTRLLLLSDMIHASDYFAGKQTAVSGTGLYGYSFALLDVDYLSWHGKVWSAGFGGGLSHQGFLIPGAERSAHAVVGRLRGQLYLFWAEFLATQTVLTLPIAFYQGSTDSFRMLQGELNIMLDFTGHVRNPEAQTFLFSLSLHYDYTRLTHAVRSYEQHEFTPMIKAMVLY
ncbi:MAG: hypothetical protein OHK0011_04390 [Turneriella sp.]